MWTLSAITGVLTRGRKSEFGDRSTERWSHDNGGRDGSDEATSLIMPGASRVWMRQEGPSLGAWEGAHPC